MKTVIVASLNPAKIRAVESAFTTVFHDDEFDFIGVSVPSNVSEQPMTDHETHQGALNRVKNAKLKEPDCDFYVGLEAGYENGSTFAWMVIESEIQKGESRSASLPLPKTIQKELLKGEELGNVMDEFFNTSNIKQKGGAISIFTDGILTRSSVYHQALVLALTPFCHHELFLSNK
ncbi:inosine/xanthosine triphosphatase [Vibrio salinus]|uniref:inosine/xanthosine triphosphatase n=1 Tax=Vibrio salinus TaxID=2899784 RepID=UPI001E3F2D06|nr:inosine/xanthosine triphosphatase [Vibrio salinus]MCE0493216.1 inosine/xanthosine triphosphatase [Vibrio salinus]